MAELIQNDRRTLEATLSDDNGAIDLTDAAVAFAMRSVGSAGVTVGKDCDIVDAPTGEVSVDLLPADLDTPGVYLVEFQITFGDGSVHSVRSAETITVQPELVV